MGFDRLREAHLLADVGLPRLGGLDPVIWFGVIDAGTLVLGYLAVEIMGHRLDVGSVAVAARALFVVDTLTIAGVLFFALTTASFALALGAFWLVGLARRLGEPLYLAWLAQPGARTRQGRGHLDGPVERARTGGRRTRHRGRGHAGGHPWRASLAGIRAALAVAAITLSPALLLYGRAIRRGSAEPDPEGSGGAREM